MSRLTIRCRPCTPASTAELNDWLRSKVEELRAEAPHLMVRLSRLAQDLPEATIDDGWLIAVELPGDRPETVPYSVGDLLDEVLRDMRILGLAPTVLVPAALPTGGLALAPCAVHPLVEA